MACVKIYIANTEFTAQLSVSRECISAFNTDVAGGRIYRKRAVPILACACVFPMPRNRWQ